MKDRREFLKFLCSSIGLVAVGGCFAGCAGEGWYGHPERFEGVGEEGGEQGFFGEAEEGEAEGPEEGEEEGEEEEEEEEDR